MKRLAHFRPENKSVIVVLMTPEEKSLLERTYKIAEENNSILRGLRRSNRIGTAMKIFYWAVIIGVSIGALYFLQPYVDMAKDAAQQLQATLNGVNSTTNQAQGLINTAKNVVPK